MYFKSTVVAAVAACLATSVSAHMKMSSPKPYGASDLNNSPLAADGSDFPCKLRPNAYNKEGAENIMAIGEPQTLSFIGGATHGGGSCQVSLTTDLQPTKNSKWMVIKSIEGGCPDGFNGNLNDDASSTASSSFQYTIPDGIAPGEYTIAWSWINKIGNREFYMNCGPATVVSSRKKRYAPTPKISKRQTSFPDMFVANLASVNDCTTPEGFNYHYPNPGADVQEAGSGGFTQLACGAGGNTTPQQPTGAPETGPTKSADSPAQGSPTGGSAPGVPNQGSPSQVPSATESASSGQNTGFPNDTPNRPPANGSPGVFVPVETPAPATGNTSPSTGGGSDSNSTGSSGSGVAGAPGTACSPEGQWACSSNGLSFQRCASGTWSAVMAMTQGMTCTPGVSSNIAMTPSKVKRHFMHGHLRRLATFAAAH